MENQREHRRWHGDQGHSGRREDYSRNEGRGWQGRDEGSWDRGSGEELRNRDDRSYDRGWQHDDRRESGYQGRDVDGGGFRRADQRREEDRGYRGRDDRRRDDEGRSSSGNGDRRGHEERGYGGGYEGRGSGERGYDSRGYDQRGYDNRGSDTRGYRDNEDARRGYADSVRNRYDQYDRGDERRGFNQRHRDERHDDRRNDRDRDTRRDSRGENVEYQRGYLSGELIPTDGNRRRDQREWSPERQQMRERDERNREEHKRHGDIAGTWRQFETWGREMDYGKTQGQGYGYNRRDHYNVDFLSQSERSRDHDNYDNRW